MQYYLLPCINFYIFASSASYNIFFRWWFYLLILNYLVLIPYIGKPSNAFKSKICNLMKRKFNVELLCVCTFFKISNYYCKQLYRIQVAWYWNAISFQSSWIVVRYWNATIVIGMLPLLLECYQHGRNRLTQPFLCMCAYSQNPTICIDVKTEFDNY